MLYQAEPLPDWWWIAATALLRSGANWNSIAFWSGHSFDGEGAEFIGARQFLATFFDRRSKCSLVCLRLRALANPEHTCRLVKFSRIGLLQSLRLLLFFSRTFVAIFMLAFTAAQLFSASKTISDPLLLVEQGRVVEVASGATRPAGSPVSMLDFGDAIIAPGYIDLHIHGSAGYDVMDDSPEALPAIGTMLARHGVTSYFPTTVTAALDSSLRALDRLASAIEIAEKQNADGNAGDNKNDGSPTDRVTAIPIGIHLEGPFISHARRGVHPPENLIPPTLAMFEQFWQAARGQIRMMTIAPEIEGALEVIAEATSRGVCVSLGHSDADFAATVRGIEAGARHATHTFNAMRPLDHRAPGILGAVLTDSRLSADIIADGVHLDPSIVKLFAEAKGPNDTVLITDAISATGKPDGRYRLGSLEVEVKGDRCTTEGKLAGSVLTMDRAVRNLAEFAQWDLAAAVMAASRNPAQTARLKGKGNLLAGADADFVVLTRDGKVLRSFVGGVEAAR